MIVVSKEGGIMNFIECFEFAGIVLYLMILYNLV